MNIFSRASSFIVSRFRDFTICEIGFFKLSMLFAGAFFAACLPECCSRNKKWIGVLAAIFTGTFLGYLCCGERYFDLPQSSSPSRGNSADTL